MPKENLGTVPHVKESEDALNLVRRLPAIVSGWTGVKTKKGKIIVTYKYHPHWAEVRGSTLLLFNVRDGNSGAAASTGTDASNLVHKVKKEDITLVNLKDSVRKLNERKFYIKIKSIPDKNTVIRFKSLEEVQSWFTHLANASDQRTIGLADFEIINSLGKGASGKVFRVRDKLTDEELALKVIEKSSVYENQDAYRHALDERLVMELACNHPFILNLRYAFQTKQRLYLVTEFCGAGDLFDHLKRRGKPLPERQAKRMSGEILLALQHIHKLGVVYRDMKLENILLDMDGHVRVADFGLSKMLKTKNAAGFEDLDPTKTFCGTREYVAPEMLSGDAYGLSVDVWAFGILLYEVLCGRTPFYASNRDDIYDRIENAPLKFPRFLSSDVVSLIRNLLDRNPATRLGMGPDGLEEIKRHPWYADVDWDALYNVESHPDNIVIDLSQNAKYSDDESEDEDANFEFDEDSDSSSVGGGKRDVWSLFLASRKKASSIAGYSFTSSTSASQLNSFVNSRQNSSQSIKSATSLRSLGKKQTNT